MDALRRTLIAAGVLACMSAGPVWAGFESDGTSRGVRLQAAVDMDDVNHVRSGRGSGPMPQVMAAQERRLREYLALHARAVDDGRLLRWSVAGVRPRVH